MTEGNAAVLELDTAPVEVETTELEAPESVLPEGTETVSSDISTDSDEATEENEAPTLTREEHEKALKDVEARLTESFRQKTENAQRQAEDAWRAEAFKQNVTKAAQARSASTYQQIAGVVQNVIQRRENGEEIDLSPQWLAGIAAQQADAAYYEEDASYQSAFNAYVAQQNPGWRKPPEVAAAEERALHLPPSDPNRIPQLFEARMRVFEAAVRERVTPKLREEIEAEVRAEMGAAKTTAAMKNNDAARAGQPKPTGVGTTGGASVNHRAVMESPTATLEQKGRAYKALYGREYGS